MAMEPGISDDYLPMDPKRLLERLHTALNTRDLDNLLRCFHVDYESQQPGAPDQAYTGLDRLHEDWATIFTEMPDFQADLLRSTVDADIIWSEWHWQGGLGRGPDGTPELNQVGVLIFGVEDELIAWARIYMEAVDEGAVDRGAA